MNFILCTIEILVETRYIASGTPMIHTFIQQHLIFARYLREIKYAEPEILVPEVPEAKPKPKALVGLGHSFPADVCSSQKTRMIANML